MNDFELDRRAACGALLGALGATALGGSCAQRSPVATSARSDSGCILVLLELFGGVDGLSTLVPFDDDDYRRARPNSALAKNEVLPIHSARGLHPNLPKLRARYERGEVAFVEGCGYAEPIYSHFRSMDVWHTARRSGRVSGIGWIGRLRDALWPARDECELVVHVGGDMPWSIASDAHPPLVFGSPGSFRALGRPIEAATVERIGRNLDKFADAGATPRDALLHAMRSNLSRTQDVSARVQAAVANHRPRAVYPQEFLAQKLHAVASLIDSDFPTRVYSVAHGNYDSHGNELAIYRELHARLDSSLDAFLEDVAGCSRGRDVVVLAFSEFGRRFHENLSGGTDHGAAGPMWLAGQRVRGGLHGRHPSLAAVDEDDNLLLTTDFRRVYASVLEQGFGIDAERILGERVEALDLLRA